MGDVLDEFEADADVEALHGALDARDQRGARGELIDAQADEQRGERDLAGHLAADADPEIVGVPGIETVLMRRMMAGCVGS